jgi:hypothetical protein
LEENTESFLIEDGQMFKDKFKKIQEESLRINNTLLKNNSEIKKVLELEINNVIKKIFHSQNC